MRPAGAPVRLRFDGREIEALPGETIAAALAAADIVAVRQARSGAPRGPFCGMGACFDCLVTVDGRPNQRACLTKVAGRHVTASSRPARRRGTPAPAPAAQEIACDVLVVGAGTGRPVGGRALRAEAGASVVVARRAPASGRAVFQAAGAVAARPMPRPDRQFADGAALREAALGGRRADPERGHGLGGVRARLRSPPSSPAARPFPAQAPGAGDRRLRAVAAGAGLDPARRDDDGRRCRPWRAPIACAGRARSWSPATARSTCRSPASCWTAAPMSWPCSKQPAARPSRHGAIAAGGIAPSPALLVEGLGLARGCAGCCTGIAG